MDGLLRSWLYISIQTQKIIPKAVTSIGFPKEAITPRFLNIFGVFRELLVQFGVFAPSEDHWKKLLQTTMDASQYLSISGSSAMAAPTAHSAETAPALGVGRDKLSDGWSSSVCIFLKLKKKISNKALD